MQPWSELVRLFLLGAERAHLPPALGGILARAGVEVDAALPQVLLEGLAVFNQVRKARLPLGDLAGALPPAAPPGEGNLCPPAAIRHLSRIMDGTYAPALPEFIRLLTRQGYILAPEFLPELLQACRRDPLLWVAFKPAIGQRGEWLIRQHPEWRTLLPATDTAQWEKATREDRLAILRELRATTPAQALVLLEKSWPQEHFRDKLLFLDTLETALSLADEPFLEQCRQDRRKEVRLKAAGLLASLPGSAVAEHLWTHAAHLFAIDKKGKLQTDPSRVEPEGQIRGLFDPAPLVAGKGGLQAAWCFLLVSHIPPGRWEEHFRHDFDGVVGLMARSDAGDLLLEGLATAILRFADASRAEKLVRYLNRQQGRRSIDGDLLERLLRFLPWKAVSELALDALRKTPILPGDSLAARLLGLGAHPWSDALSLTLIGHFQDHLSAASTYSWDAWHYQGLLEVAAYQCNPGLLAGLDNRWPCRSPVWPRWEQAVQRFVRVLTFRKEMTESFEKKQH